MASFLAVSILAIASFGSPPLPAKEVVSRLDAYYQSLLHDLELTKPKKVKVKDARTGKEYWVERGKGTFGLSRMVLIPRVPGHGELGGSAKDKQLTRRAQEAEAGWRTWLYLAGNGTKPVSAKDLRVQEALGWGAIIPNVKSYPTSEQATKLAKRIMSSKSARLDETQGAWHWAASRVVFKNKACLSCHPGSKLGDTAGVIVYAMHPDKRAGKGEMIKTISPQEL